MLNQKVSIIIRTKNEEKWVGLCLDAIYKQTYKNFEVIIVDNSSTDGTVKKANQWPIKLVSIKKFLPGDAINKGIQASSGDLIVCLSAHCIPASINWLKNIISPLESPNIGCVYGKQMPLSSSSNLNKRDLFIVFGDEYREQSKDTFFHNANSAFSKSLWKKIPFNSSITNIEDRLWGQEIIGAGLKIAYQPDAPVYHHHGIHQDADEQRANKIVSIMENDSFSSEKLSEVKEPTKDIALIYDIQDYDKFREELLKITILSLQSHDNYEDIIFSGNSKHAEKICKENNILYFKRDTQQISKDSLSRVIKNTLQDFEKTYYIPDSLTVTSVNYPLKETDTYARLLTSFYNAAMIPTISGYLEKRPMISVGEKERVLNTSLIPRETNNQGVYICPIGHGYVDSPSRFRDEKILSGKVNMLPTSNANSFNEINSQDDLINNMKLLKNV